MEQASAQGATPTAGMAAPPSSAWWQSDKQYCVVGGAGQITPGTRAGQLIIQTLHANRLATVVDIGTWNGLGSTACCLIGLQGRSDVQFLSFESNREKNQIALVNCAPLLPAVPRAELIWGSLIRPEEIEAVSLVELFPDLAKPECVEWHTVDMENMRQAPYVLDRLPPTLDFVLFDGGEFTTYFEFRRIRDRCTRFIALDDVHSAKCARIRAELQADPEWIESVYLEDRNGFSLFKRAQ